MKFSELGLAEPIVRATDALGYKSTTPIQTEAIPVVLAGRDLIGCAQTGTGKTAAFLIACLHKLLNNQPKESAKKNPIRALVVAPTRELAIQR